MGALYGLKPNTMKTLIVILIIINSFSMNAQYSQPMRIFERGQVDIQAAVGPFPAYIAADKPSSIFPPFHFGIRRMADKHLNFFLL